MQQWLEQHRDAVLASLLVGLGFSFLLGGALFVVKRPLPAPILIQPLDVLPGSTLTPTQTPQPILVYVLGSVIQPGVYALGWDSRVQQAVLAAGGLSPNADPVRVNLAERVHDGQQLYIPALGEAAPVLPTPGTAASSVSNSPQSGSRINLNTADAAALVALPGIGPTLSQRIVDYRQLNGPFAQIDDIKRVKGIGDAIFSQIRDLITVE